VLESSPQQLLQQQHSSAASSNRHKEEEEEEEEEETSIWSEGENRTIVGTTDGLRGFEERGPQTRGPGPRIGGPDETSLSRQLQLIQSLTYDECFWEKKEKEREKDEKGEKKKEGTRELKTLEDISCMSHVSRKSFVRERPSTGQLFLGGSGGGVLNSTFNYPLHSTPKEPPTLLPLNSPPASRDDHVAWSGDLDPQTTEWRRRRRRMERGEGEDDRQLGTGYFSIGISDHCRPENHFTRRPSEDHLIRRPSEDQRLVDRLLYRKRHDDVMADKENWFCGKRKAVDKRRMRRQEGQVTLDPEADPVDPLWMRLETQPMEKTCLPLSLNATPGGGRGEKGRRGGKGGSRRRPADHRMGIKEEEKEEEERMVIALRHPPMGRLLSEGTSAAFVASSYAAAADDDDDATNDDYVRLRRGGDAASHPQKNRRIISDCQKTTTTNNNNDTIITNNIDFHLRELNVATQLVIDDLRSTERSRTLGFVDGVSFPPICQSLAKRQLPLPLPLIDRHLRCCLSPNRLTSGEQHDGHRRTFARRRRCSSSHGQKMSLARKLFCLAGNTVTCSGSRRKATTKIVRMGRI